jgi:hypothetical protein
MAFSQDLFEDVAVQDRVGQLELQLGVLHAQCP